MAEHLSLRNYGLNVKQKRKLSQWCHYHISPTSFRSLNTHPSCSLPLLLGA